jgi:Trypsin-co-occurring domain 1
MMKAFAGLVRRSDKIAARFGIRLAAKAGAFIDSANMEAQFTAALNWENSSLINSAR